MATLTINGNGGNGATVNANANNIVTFPTVTHGQTSTRYVLTINGNGGNGATANCDRKTTYTLSGYSTSASGSTSYRAGQTRRLVKNSTYYAIWNSSTSGYVTFPSTTHAQTCTRYTITINGNGGNNTSASCQKTATYTLSGYSTSATGSTSYRAGQTRILNAHSTYYAIWMSSVGGSNIVTFPNTSHGQTSTRYVLTINGNGGNNTSANCDRKTTYTLSGYSTSANGSTSYRAGQTRTLNANSTYYAIWNSSTSGYVTFPSTTHAQTCTTYTLTINGNGGNNTSTSCGKTATYTLSGYSTSANGSTSYKAGNTRILNAHSTYYAIWSSSVGSSNVVTFPSTTHGQTSTRYVLTINGNGGNGATANCDRKTTYTLSGYSTSATSTTSYKAGQTRTLNANSTYYAIWNSSTSGYVTFPTVTRANSSTTYTLTINGNGGNNTSASVNRVATYSLSGYSTSATGDTSYKAGNTRILNANSTYYAIWNSSVGASDIVTFPSTTHGQTSTRYTLTLMANGGNANATANCDRKTTYTLSGYSTSSSGSTSYKAGQTRRLTANCTYYAIWDSSTSGYATFPNMSKSNTANVLTLNGNGGTVTPTSTKVGKEYSYSLSGYSTSATGTTSYKAGQTRILNANSTYYAIWNATLVNNYGAFTLPTATKAAVNTSFTVTFNANGGSVSPTSMTATKKVNYTFNKWNTASNGSGTSLQAGTSYSDTGNRTLYAIYSSQTSNTGEITLPIPTRSGYVFIGWGTSSTATSGQRNIYLPTANITLYAIWEKDSYVSQVYDGSNFISYITQIHNGTSYENYITFIY